jgi:plastocyanin
MRRILFAGTLLVLSAAGLMLVGQGTTPPGTSADRIGYPQDYQSTFKKLYTFDNNNNRQIRVIWANDAAQSVDAGQPWNFPYGSELIFESWTPQLDGDGNPVLDDDGRFIPTTLTTVFVMKKQQGFGAEYGPVRNGEWEYISYNPDGSFATAPSGTGACALCHLTGSSQPMTVGLPPINAANDYVFRANQMFRHGTGALPGGVLQNYLFVPNTIHVKAGSTLTIYNDDDIVHTIAADDGSFKSDFLGTGGSYTMKFDQPGQVPIHCTLHGRMRGMVIVDPADGTADGAGYGHNTAARR